MAFGENLGFHLSLVNCYESCYFKCCGRQYEGFEWERNLPLLDFIRNPPSNCVSNGLREQ